MIKVCEQQEKATCVYVVKQNAIGEYRSNGSVFIWQSEKPVAVGDNVYVEGQSKYNFYNGKVLSVFKVLAEDAEKFLKAFPSIDEALKVGVAV